MAARASGQRDARVAVQGERSGVVAALLVGGLCLLGLLANLVHQARLPAAGAHVLRVNELAWQDDGAVVRSLREDGLQGEAGAAETGVLQDGDVVLAVDGRSLAGSARDIALGRSSVSWERGDVVQLEILREGQPTTVSLQLESYPQLTALADAWSMVLFSFTTFLVGAFVLWRRPLDRASRPLFVWGASQFGSMGWALGMDVVQMFDSVHFWLHMLSAGGAFLLFWMSGLHLGLIFPQPYPMLQRRPWVVPLIYVLGVAAELGLAALLVWQGGPTAWLYALLRAVIVVAAPLGLLMILAVLWGYRTFYTEDGRRRARTFLFTGALCGGAGLLLWLVAPFLTNRVVLEIELAGLLLLPIPLSLAVAIVRHRLFDIDVIIRRTAIYTLLTAALAAIYFGSVVVLQSLLGIITSGGLSDLAIVLSTLAIATLFSPLRRWIQTMIDRRFYRSKYDARATVARFAEAARNEVDLDALNEELVGLIQQTVQPSFVGVWLVQERRN